MDRILSAYEFAIEVAARGALAKRPLRINPAKVTILLSLVHVLRHGQ